jgi:hypothetical protein
MTSFRTGLKSVAETLLSAAFPTHANPHLLENRASLAQKSAFRDRN